jgi:hypothetical protein
MKGNKEFEYANDPAYWGKEIAEPQEPPAFWKWVFTSTVIQLLVYLLFITAIVYALYKIVISNKLFLFYTPPKKISSSSETLMLEKEEDFDNLINQAITQKDYQEATRFLYIKGLRLLNNKGLIQYHPDTTNRQYLETISGHKASSHFDYLTRIYDYVWYGKFEISESQFSTVQKSFQLFYNLI